MLAKLVPPTQPLRARSLFLTQQNKQSSPDPTLRAWRQQPKMANGMTITIGDLVSPQRNELLDHDSRNELRRAPEGDCQCQSRSGAPKPYVMQACRHRGQAKSHQPDDRRIGPPFFVDTRVCHLSHLFHPFPE